MPATSNIAQSTQGDNSVEVRLPTAFCREAVICRQGGKREGMSRFELGVLQAVMLLGMDELMRLRKKGQDWRVKDDLDEERRNGKYHMNSVLLGQRNDWRPTTKGRSMKVLARKSRAKHRGQQLTWKLPETFTAETTQRELLGLAMGDAAYEPGAKYKRALMAALDKCEAVKSHKHFTADGRNSHLILTLRGDWFPLKGYARVPWPMEANPIEATLRLRFHGVKLDDPSFDAKDAKDVVRYTTDLRTFCERLGINTNCQPSHWRRRLFAALKGVNDYSRAKGLDRYTIKLVGKVGDRVRLGRR